MFAISVITCNTVVQQTNIDVWRVLIKVIEQYFSGKDKMCIDWFQVLGWGWDSCGAAHVKESKVI